MIEISGPEFCLDKSAKNLVILLHGWGANGNNFIEIGKAMSKFLPNSFFVAPNAPFEREVGGYQWFSLEDRSEVAILTGIKKAADILNDFIDIKLKSFGFSEKQLSLVGFSQGAMMALHTSLRRSNPCSSVVAYSGRLVAPSKLPRELKSKPNICIIHSRDDAVVPFTAFEAAVEALTNNNIEIESHSLDGIGHTIDDKGVKLGAEFIKKHFLNQV